MSDFEPNNTASTAVQMGLVTVTNNAVSLSHTVNSRGSDPVDFLRFNYSLSSTGTETTARVRPTIESYSIFPSSDVLGRGGVAGERRIYELAPGEGLSGASIKIEQQFGWAAYGDEFGTLFQTLNQISQSGVELYQQKLASGVDDLTLLSDIGALLNLNIRILSISESDGVNVVADQLAFQVEQDLSAWSSGAQVRNQAQPVIREITQLFRKWETVVTFATDASGMKVKLPSGLSPWAAEWDTVAGSSSGLMQFTGYSEGISPGTTPTFSPTPSVSINVSAALTFIGNAVSINDQSNIEGSVGATPVVFSVSLARPALAPLTVNWQVQGTGQNPASASDFDNSVLPAGTVTFQPGESSRLLSFQIVGDTAFEPDETYSVLLSFPATVDRSFFRIERAEGRGTILNDDALAPIRGTSGPDVLRAPGDSKNLFNGRGGDDTLLGGMNVDTAEYNGPRADYIVFQENSGNLVIVDIFDGRDGTDTTTSIERLRFTDGTLAVDIALPGQGASNAGSAYRLYEAAFNRTPDNPGLAFWIKQLDNGLTRLAVAQGFVNSQEFQTFYGSNPTAQQLVTSFYNNILGRAPEQGGFDFWVGILNGDPSNRAVVLDGIANSAENQNGLISTIGQGIFLPGDLLI